MSVLVLETSREICLLALVRENRLIDALIYPHDNSLSSSFFPAIETFLEKNQHTVQDLSAVAAGMGPGSYTGTRVGAITGKTLSFGRNIPFSGFCSLLAYLPETTGSFAALLPFKFGPFYLVKGSREVEALQIEFSGFVPSHAISEMIVGVENVSSPTPIEGVVTLPLKPNPEALVQALSLSISESELIYR